MNETNAAADNKRIAILVFIVVTFKFFSFCNQGHQTDMGHLIHHRSVVRFRLSMQRLLMKLSQQILRCKIAFSSSVGFWFFLILGFSFNSLHLCAVTVQI